MKTPISILSAFAVALLCSMLCAGSLFAAGRAVIKPHVEIGWQADSNFHKSQTNEKEVFTYFASPGLELGYTTDKSLISLDYFATIWRYDDRDNVAAGQLKAEDFDYVGHRAMFTAQTQATERFLIGLDNLFMKTRDPANADANSNAVDRYKYTMNQLTPRLTYKFGEKFGIDLKYKNLNVDYSDDGAGQGEDYMENRGEVTLNYYFTPKTSMGLDYQYWETDYDKTTVDYSSNQVMLGVFHQFNKFTLGAGAGYHDRDFDGTVTSGDVEMFVWKTSIKGETPSKVAGVPKSSVFVQLGSNLNDAGSGNSYYNSSRFDAKLSYFFFDRINATVSGYFQNSDYETSTREDDRWYADLALDYVFNEYFSFGVKGGLEERDSNDNTKDYDNEFVMVNVKFNYNLGSK